jgi:hypothetical protein
MGELTIDNINTEELVLEIENVIKKGLKKILNNYVDRFDLLEETHKRIMSLPSVMNELNQNQNQNHNYKNFNPINLCQQVEPATDSINMDDIANMTKNLIKGEICSIEEKLENMEKKYESLTPLLENILRKIDLINDDVTSLKNNKVNVQSEKNLLIGAPSIVINSINENIKFEIKEEEKEVVAEEESEEEEEEESEEEEEEEEEEDEEEEVVEEVKEVVKEEDEIETEASESEEEEEEAEEEEEEVVVEEKAEEEEEELFELEIDDITYCTNDEENGFIYELTEDGDVGEKVGYFKESEPFFYADEK